MQVIDLELDYRRIVGKLLLQFVELFEGPRGIVRIQQQAPVLQPRVGRDGLKIVLLAHPFIVLNRLGLLPGLLVGLGQQ